MDGWMDPQYNVWYQVGPNRINKITEMLKLTKTTNISKMTTCETSKILFSNAFIDLRLLCICV